MFYEVESHNDLTVKAFLILFPYAFPLHQVQNSWIQNKKGLFIFCKKNVVIVFLKKQYADFAGTVIWVKPPLVCAQHDTLKKHRYPSNITETAQRPQSPEHFLIKMSDECTAGNPV